MDLEDRIRALVARVSEGRMAMPFRAPTDMYPVAWLDRAAPDVWDGYPELDDVADELGGYVALADLAIEGGEHRCVVVARAAPHAVAVFEDGFHVVAPSLDAFIEDVLLAPGASPRPVAPADESQRPSIELAERAIAEHDWSLAQAHLEQLLSTWKDPDELTGLRGRLARVLAELGDVTAGEKLGAEHARYLAWLARDERERAVALQARFGVLLDEARDAISQDAGVLAAIRKAVAAPLPEVASASAISADDIATAIRLIRSTKAMQLRSLLDKTPKLVEVSEIKAALAEMPATPRADEVRKLVVEAASKASGG